MERLTKRDEKGFALSITRCGDGCKYGSIDTCNYECDKDFIERLAEYEDAEEQGLLLRLPCRVGDMLYYPEKEFNIVIPIRLNEIVISFEGLGAYSIQYNCYSYDDWGDYFEDYEFDEDDFGKTVFLTQAEAEQKLKEMNTDNGITE